MDDIAIAMYWVGYCLVFGVLLTTVMRSEETKTLKFLTILILPLMSWIGVGLIIGSYLNAMDKKSHDSKN